MVCNDALALALDCNQKKICVASDCQQVVRNITEMLLYDDTPENSIICMYLILPCRYEGRDSIRETHNLLNHSCSLGSGQHL